MISLQEQSHRMLSGGISLTAVKEALHGIILMKSESGRDLPVDTKLGTSFHLQVALRVGHLRYPPKKQE